MLSKVAIVLLTAYLTDLSTPTPLRLKDSRFQYSVDRLADNSSGENLLVQQGTKIIQRIPLSKLAAQQPAETIQLKDVNFDGQADLVITSARGVVNNMFTYWLYDSHVHKFRLDTNLSDKVGGFEVKFDSIRKRIITASRDGCCAYQYTTYRFVGKRLKTVQVRKESK